MTISQDECIRVAVVKNFDDIFWRPYLFKYLLRKKLSKLVLFLIELIIYILLPAYEPKCKQTNSDYVNDSLNFAYLHRF